LLSRNRFVTKLIDTFVLVSTIGLIITGGLQLMALAIRNERANVRVD